MTKGQDCGGGLGLGEVKLEMVRYAVDVLEVDFNIALLRIRAPSIQQLNIVIYHARPSG